MIDDTIDRIGKKFCVLCERVSEEFGEAGERKRPNVRCPRCGSVERHRLSWLFLKERTAFLKDDMKLLHFAPERCLERRFQGLGNIDYLSVDLDASRAMRAEDIQNLSFDDATFDAIYVSHVLEHIPKDIDAMQEMYRVLKPGGWVLVMVPIYPKKVHETYEDDSIVLPEERFKHFGQSDHLRWYGLDIVERLTGVGFEVETYEFPDDFSELENQLKDFLGLPGKDWIFFCTKS